MYPLFIVHTSRLHLSPALSTLLHDLILIHDFHQDVSKRCILTNLLQDPER